MADSHQHPIADVRVIALYPGRITSLANRHGVRFRKRKKAAATLVPCRIDALDGRSIATPEYPIPEGTPTPTFRLQFETTRTSVDERRMLCVVLAAERDGWKTDPEQTLLSPIFDDGHRMIFEFRRAYILRLDRRGELETRFVAVDPARGIVGSKTVHKFDTRSLGLAGRCVEHLAGAIDLFPMCDRRPLGAERIPVGEANLSFDLRRNQDPRP